MKCLFVVALIAVVYCDYDYYGGGASEPEPPKPTVPQCGGKPYNEQPIVWYEESGRCYALRQGCVPRTIKTTFSTLEQCVKSYLSYGRAFTMTTHCRYDRIFLNETFGVNKYKVPPMVQDCQTQLNVCGVGETCSQDGMAIGVCCTDNFNNDQYTQLYKLAVNYADIGIVQK